MQENRQLELSRYRLKEATDTLQVARNCYEGGYFKDAINRSYYSVFYAIKAVLALGVVDFKRHKDVVAYFNKEFVAKEIFPREMGRRLAELKQLREKSDYDDFYIASRDKAAEQIRTAEYVLEKIKEYLQFTSTTNGG